MTVQGTYSFPRRAREAADRLKTRWRTRARHVRLPEPERKNARLRDVLAAGTALTAALVVLSFCVVYGSALRKLPAGPPSPGTQTAKVSPGVVPESGSGQIPPRLRLRYENGTLSPIPDKGGDQAPTSSADDAPGSEASSSLPGRADIFPDADAAFPERLRPAATAATADLSREAAKVSSSFVLLADVSRGVSLAERSADARMYPASMTKIMTLLLAAELLEEEELDDSFTVTADIVKTVADASGSSVSLTAGERVKVRDLIYATALPSACDAAMCLARYISGTEEAFCEIMNAKAYMLGMTGTHFSNASGLHDKNNYSTARDMACLMTCAMQNDFLYRILSTRTYTMSATNRRGAHTVKSTMFSNVASYAGGRTPGTVTLLGGKTGTSYYAGKCLASFARGADGSTYVLVTGGAPSAAALMDDTLLLYSAYVPQ